MVGADEDRLLTELGVSEVGLPVVVLRTGRLLCNPIDAALSQALWTREWGPKPGAGRRIGAHTTTEDDMQITRNSTETVTGPSEWFTSAVFIDTVTAPSEASRLSASSVHFTPGARTAWHSHPNGQTIWVTEGIGGTQRRDGPIEVIRPGDRVFFEPGEEHWHGAAPNRFITHLAILAVDDEGNAATWGDHLTGRGVRGRAADRGGVGMRAVVLELTALPELAPLADGPHPIAVRSVIQEVNR